MAKIAFPTRPGPYTKGVNERSLLGEPDEADPCDGHHAVVIEDTCIRCGHYPARTIRKTFEQRAKAVARR